MNGSLKIILIIILLLHLRQISCLQKCDSRIKPSIFSFQTYLTFKLNPKDFNYTKKVGSLISPQFVLTTANGLIGVQEIHITLGSNRQESDALELSSRIIIFHPQFNATALKNDIALVELPEKVPNCHANPITLAPPFDYLVQDQMAYVLNYEATFGKMYREYYAKRVLDNEECQPYFPPNAISNTQLCTRNFKNPNASTCLLANGEILAIEEEQQWILIGIGSFFAEDKCQDGEPHVYTRISKYRTWLDNTVRESESRIEKDRLHKLKESLLFIYKTEFAMYAMHLYLAFSIVVVFPMIYVLCIKKT